MFAGAFGNLTDRVFRNHVVDFIDIGPWWIFNIADASIVTGLTVLGVTVALFNQSTEATRSLPPEGTLVAADVGFDTAHDHAVQDQNGDNR